MIIDGYKKRIYLYTHWFRRFASMYIFYGYVYLWHVLCKQIGLGE